MFAFVRHYSQKSSQTVFAASSPERRKEGGTLGPSTDRGVEQISCFTFKRCLTLGLHFFCAMQIALNSYIYSLVE